VDDKEGERRAAERVLVNDEFQRLGGDGIAYVSNLSGTGVFVHTSQLLPIGTKIELRFTLLLDDPVLIEAAGDVVRHQTGEQSGMGVRFGPMSPQMVLRIQDAIAQRRPRDSGAPIKIARPSAPTSSGEGSESHDLESQVTGVFRPVNDHNATQRLPALGRDDIERAPDDGADDEPTAS